MYRLEIQMLAFFSSSLSIHGAHNDFRQELWSTPITTAHTHSQQLISLNKAITIANAQRISDVAEMHDRSYLRLECDQRLV